jgi:hypothetical protein
MNGRVYAQTQKINGQRGEDQKMEEIFADCKQESVPYFTVKSFILCKKFTCTYNKVL